MPIQLKQKDKYRQVEKSFILNGTIFSLLQPAILHQMTKLKSQKSNKTPPLLRFKYTHIIREMLTNALGVLV